VCVCVCACVRDVEEWPHDKALPVASLVYCFVDTLPRHLPQSALYFAVRGDPDSSVDGRSRADPHVSSAW